MREKLIEILHIPVYPHESADLYEVVADYLLDNDVVPVVRCKDCRKCSVYDDVVTGQKQYICRLWHCATREVDEESFCSAGERKDND